MMQILERLRQAREEQGLDVDALARRTRLPAHVLEALEQGRWSALPRGVYARAVVRAYAEAVGMNPNGVVTEVAPMLPEPEDPLDGLARLRGLDRAPAAPDTIEPAAASGVEHAPPAMQRALREAAVSAIDGGLLGTVMLVLTALTAALCGVPVATLVDMAAPAMGMLAILVAALYFLLLGGIGGATLGARLMAPGTPPRAFRGSGYVAMQRAGSLALREASIVVGLLLPWPSPAQAIGRRAAPRSGTRWEARAPAR